MSQFPKGAIDVRYSKKGNMRVFNKSIQQRYSQLAVCEPEQFFQVTFRGHTFNALPFLLSSASYWDSSVLGGIYTAIAKAVPTTKAVQLEELHKDHLIDYKLMLCLMPGDVGDRELASYLYIHSRQDAIRLIYISAIQTLNKVIIDGVLNHAEYSCSGLCNTQAFCYYMQIYWLLGLDPSYRQYLGLYLKKTNFDLIFEKLCPEDSIHYKYICGELSVEELAYEYTVKEFEDRSTVVIREAYSDLTRGEYDGHLMSAGERFVGLTESQRLVLLSEYAMNAALSYAYLYSGTYATLTGTNDKLQVECEHLKSVSSRDRDRYKAANGKVQELKNKVKSLEHQVSSLQSDIAKHKTDVKLMEEIAQLRAQLSSANDEIGTMFDERLRLKQELSRKTKQIKKLSALVPDSEEAIGVVEESLDTSLDAIIDALKDKRIITIDGTFSRTLADAFESWGFTQFRRMSGSGIRKAQCDIVVICASFCSHADVALAERVLSSENTEFVYTSSTNAELILRTIYDAVM